MKFKFRTLLLSIMLLSVAALQAQTREYTFSHTAQSEGLSVEQNTRSLLTMRHTLNQVAITTITDNGYTGDVVQGGTQFCAGFARGRVVIVSWSLSPKPKACQNQHSKQRKAVRCICSHDA